MILDYSENAVELTVNAVGLTVMTGDFTDEGVDGINYYKLDDGVRVVGMLYKPDTLSFVWAYEAEVNVILRAHFLDGTVFQQAGMQALFPTTFDEGLGVHKMFDISMPLNIAENTELYFTVDVVGPDSYLLNPFQSSPEIFYSEYLTSLSIALSSTEIFAGEAVGISGLLTYGPDGVSEGVLPGFPVQVRIQDSSGAYIWTATVNTAADGIYNTSKVIPSAGIYTISAVFAGGEI